MKKYLYIFKSNLMSELQYITNIILGFITYFVIIFIFLNLWQYIYSDPNEIINGYSMNQMVWYVIITEILWMASGGRKLCRKISDDVKSGNISYNINKPYNYIGYSISSHLSKSLLSLVLYSIAGVILGLLLLGTLAEFTIIMIPFVIISSILAILINSIFVMAIGLISFWIEDSSPFYWVYSKVILVLGTMFPIEYFPKIIQKILSFSPVYVTTYGPAKLFVDFSWTNLGLIILFQVIYIVIALLICNLIYRKGVKRLNVNGG